MDCLFCHIIAKELPADIVFEDDRMLAFRDIHPKADVHILFVPKKHVASLTELETGDDTLMGSLLRQIGLTAVELGVGEGFKVAINNGRTAGQEVDHLHLHLLANRQAAK